MHAMNCDKLCFYLFVDLQNQPNIYPPMVKRYVIYVYAYVSTIFSYKNTYLYIYSPSIAVFSLELPMASMNNSFTTAITGTGAVPMLENRRVVPPVRS